jgi:hypothetical protein
MEARRMNCNECGQDAPGDANFCPSCGAPLTAVHPASEDTTAAIEIGALDPQHEVEDFPELAPGTGMLVVVRGPNAGSRFLLDRETTTVGRHPDSDIFLDDVTVSRRHAELIRGERGTLLKDLGSLNGTYVGGDRVDERTLAMGDEVQVGRFKLLYLDAHGAQVVSDA